MGIWAVMLLSMTLALGQTQPPDIQQKCWKLLDDAAQDRNPDVRKDAAEALSLAEVRHKTRSKGVKDFGINPVWS